MIEYQKQKDGDFHVKFSNVKMSELSEFKNNRNIESTFETMGMGFAKLDGCKNYSDYRDNSSFPVEL